MIGHHFTRDGETRTVVAMVTSGGRQWVRFRTNTPHKRWVLLTTWDKWVAGAVEVEKPAERVPTKEQWLRRRIVERRKVIR